MTLIIFKITIAFIVGYYTGQAIGTLASYVIKTKNNDESAK